MLDTGKVLMFFRNTTTGEDVNEIRNLSDDYFDNLGERDGEDFYHVYMIEDNLNLNKKTTVGMDCVVRLLDPFEYVRNLLTANYSMLGFIMPKTTNSQTVFDGLKASYEKIVDATNQVKELVRHENEGENLHRT